MVGFCAVACCNNYGKKIPGISYHRFPNDRKLCKEWIRLCKRTDKFSITSAAICSLHFQASDYKTSEKEELLNLPKKKRHLKNDAIPSLNLHHKESRPKRCTLLSRAVEKRALQLSNSQTKRLKGNTDDVEQIEVVPDVANGQLDLELVEADDQKSDLESEDDERRVKNCKLELEQCKKINSAHLMAYKKQQMLINQQVLLISNLKEKVSLFSKERKEVNRMVNEKVNSVLKPFFSQSQINYLLLNKSSQRAMRWTGEDICLAIIVRSTSRIIYDYLRKDKLPLPGELTLLRWKQNVKCAPGLLKEVFHLLKSKASMMNDFERLCVLKFDEMAVDPRYCYDKVLDRVFGTHSKVQVVMLQGLKDNWRQPIFFDFDTPMGVELLFKVIEKVEACGLKVVAVVNDMDARHDNMWKTLNVSVNKPYFELVDRKIYVFCDAPRLLKLLRNNIIDEGLYLEDGTTINKKLFAELLNVFSSEKLTHHISQANISECEEDRQSVLLAARLLSSRTSAAITRKLSKLKESGFIQLVNDVFDVLNSKILVDEKCSMRSAYGYNKLTYHQQTDTLKTFLNFCLKMSFGHRMTLLSVQKCLIITINSLFGIYEHVTGSGGKYLLTTRLNQDCLENYFSQNWEVGSVYDSPSPAELHSRLRLLVLNGGSRELADSESNSDSEEEEENGEGDTLRILSHQLLKSVKNIRCGVSKDETEELVDEVLKELNKFMILGNIQVNNDNPASSTSEQVYEINFKELSVDQELRTDNETYGLVYVAGYVANKCRNLDATLGDPNSTLAVKHKQDWIAVLAKGGLIQPTDKWVEMVKKLEHIFCAFIMSGVEISNQTAIKTLTLRIRENVPNLSIVSSKVFAITRLFIHLRFLNKTLMCQLIKAAQSK